MKRAAIVMATAWVAVTASAVVQADQSKVDQKFCEAVASFQSNAAQLNAMGPNSTVGEVRAARKRLDNDVDKMRTAAFFMTSSTAKQFRQAMSQLDRDVDHVRDDATLQQAYSQIQSDVRNAQSTGQQLAAEAGCPQTTPPQSQ
jgi:hypothetical protein